jgi:hypothetical protein
VDVGTHRFSCWCCLQHAHTRVNEIAIEGWLGFAFQVSGEACLNASFWQERAHAEKRVEWSNFFVLCLHCGEELGKIPSDIPTDQDLPSACRLLLLSPLQLLLQERVPLIPGTF